MKNILFISLFFGALFLTSCKKNYNCACKVVSKGVEKSLNFPIIDETKKKAEEMCQYEVKNTGTKGVCELQ